MRILIVDDDGDLRTLLGLCFLRRLHGIVALANGKLAVSLPMRDPLVTDLNMPVLDAGAAAPRTRTAIVICR